MNTMNGSASKSHGDHRACGETCKGKGLGWWCLRKEGIQAIPAKDILSLGQRKLRAGQIRGERGTCEDMCPALNEHEQRLCGGAGLLVELGDRVGALRFISEAMLGSRSEELCLASCPQVDPWGLG